jgi:hypothetical protein
MTEALECFRCQMASATVLCRNCDFGQQFCEECSRMRGKKVKDRYSCVFCLFLKNTVEEENYYVTEEVYRATKRSREFYVPQLEDRVRFFFQGYEEFLTQHVTKLNTEAYKKNEQFRLLPHTEDNALSNTPLCEVVSIEHFFPLKAESNPNAKRTPGKGERAPIQMLVGLKEVSTEQLFWVFYWPGYEFLVPEEVYQLIEEKEMVTRLSINQLVNVRGEEMQVVELGPFEDRFP